MMKYFTHTNAGKLKLNFRTKMNLLTTGLIFVLLLLSTFLGNGVMILLIHHGFINAGPPSSQIPLLIQTGIISIIIGTLITLLISHLPLKPLHTLVEAIHQVSTGNYDVKIHLEHPAEFREVSDCFNHMTEELSCTEMLRSDFIKQLLSRIQDPDCLRSWIREIIKIRPTHKRSTRRISGHYYRRVQALIRTFHDHT